MEKKQKTKIEWHRPCDKLPEEGQTVLVCYSHNDFFIHEWYRLYQCIKFRADLYINGNGIFCYGYLPVEYWTPFTEPDEK